MTIKQSVEQADTSAVMVEFLEEFVPTNKMEKAVKGLRKVCEIYAAGTLEHIAEELRLRTERKDAV